MSDPINLNKARKAKVKAVKTQVAAANRIKHGRSKAQKARDTLEADRAAKAVDQAQRED